jgi:aerobic-type carbon monoxide dehydrogenase small subunit (CoxS/CutS family)
VREDKTGERISFRLEASVDAASHLPGRASLKTTVRFRLNGKPTVLHTDDERHLLWVLRTELDLTGTKYGCGAGYCGACTVLIGREAVRSCRTTLKQVEGKDVVTIEGLASGDKLHPLQSAFMEHGGFQCGYCTSGMIMSACALLLANPHPAREAVVQGLERNLCRCGAHQRILAAVQAASERKSPAS